LFYE
jgi:hypothetical protein